jgi:hypothetical protein
MQGMSEPDAMKGVLCRLAGWTSVPEQRANSLTKRLSDGIEPRLIGDCVQIRLSHADRAS